MQKTKSDNTRNLYFTPKIKDAVGKIFDYPLTIVEAPMGYGKTTAVRENLLAKKTNLMWLRIYDGSVSSFWYGFCNLLGEKDQEKSKSLENLGFPDDGVTAQEAIKIISGISFEEKTALVVDDYHLLNETEVGNFLEYLVVNEISNLHIVLNARYVDFKWLEELSLKGYIHHIKKESFEFQPKEINAYYRLCGVNMKNVDPTELYSYTEGWISALYLLMLNYIEEGTFITTASIYKLVEKAIYDPFSQKTKSFLSSICIFSSFTQEQAVHMWGSEEAVELLAEITKKNAFINYDVRTKTYQVHNIFTNFLKEIVHEKDRFLRIDLNQKAGEWHLKNKNYLAAMHCFYEAKNFEDLFRTIEIDKSNSIGNDHKDDLIKYYLECPEEVKKEHPRAILVCALCYMTFNEMEHFGSACQEFVSLMEGGSFPVEETNKLMGEFELLLSFTEYNDIKKMTEHDIKAWEYLGEPAEFIDTKGCWTFGAPSVLYMFYRESGTLEQGVEDLKVSMPVYYKLTKGHGMGAEHIMEAEWYFNQGDMKSAEIELHKAINLASGNAQSEITVCGMFLQMRLLIIKGDYEGIIELYERMQAEGSQEKMYVLLHTIEVCIGYVNALLKKIEKVPTWLATGDFSSSRIYFPAIAFANMVYGRTLLAKGEFLKLIGSVEEFLSISSAFPNLLSEIYTKIYASAANEQIGRSEEAERILIETLDLAMVDKLYMPFVENCDFLRPLLIKLKKSGIHQEGIEKVLELDETYQMGMRKIHKGHFSEEKPKLTVRELEVAKLVIEGYSNKEIGEQLFISTNTVKTLLKSIFEKLGINSRALIAQNISQY